MDKLIVTIARGLVEDKDAVSVTVDEPNEEGLVVYHLHVAPDAMGRVIGKQGRIAKAIRSVVRAAANKAETKVAVEIDCLRTGKWGSVRSPIFTLLQAGRTS